MDEDGGPKLGRGVAALPISYRAREHGNHPSEVRGCAWALEGFGCILGIQDSPLLIFSYAI